MERIRSQRGLMARIRREIGVTSGAIPQWKKVPAERAEAVERVTGIPLHELRPDLWKPPVNNSEKG